MRNSEEKIIIGEYSKHNRGNDDRVGWGLKNNYRLKNDSRRV